MSAVIHFGLPLNWASFIGEAHVAGMNAECPVE